ncbi:RNB domain-containing ribonuclease [Mumia sp. zg.B53]|uniref:RNB domain-containing ribonuclease n=1 Tax=unclassified Mumia TaxID=2621872 RepID=UPI001C6E1430|nr:MULTISPECIES: RNB domain-containing ribonuclease [unclassified Mumia]MBW9215917.1 RNB domain-containing ribonuclease [Mumia sp. zg.B53]MDD9348169.1 RNB domain-containing ribonuclease [Mumia sp.]
MTRAYYSVDPSAVPALESRIDAVAQELGIDAAFPPAVLEEAATSAARVQLPDLDRTDLPLLTIDPPGARDLDQAMFIERRGEGWTVHYAIADVASYVVPGGAVDEEAHRRGQTLYAPTRRIPLHPAVLSEDAASLLPDVVRPAVLWSIDLDAEGRQVGVEVTRARVRSTAQLDYDGVQAQVAAGSGPETLTLLREVGERRQALEAERGGVSLPLPSQEIDRAEDGSWSLTFREPVPAEGWNEQISLLTGMAAAGLMLEAGVGLVRTLPPADERAVGRLKRAARGLEVPWPEAMSYPDFVRTLDPADPRHVAMLEACTGLLRGADYAAFDGAPPDYAEHSAIAAPYAHATAPLRRLADRYVSEVCLAVSAGVDVPEWVRAGLPRLPAVMAGTGRVASSFDRAVLDLVEAVVLADAVGRTFTGTVIDADDKDPTRGTALLDDPAVEAPVAADVPLPLGEPVRLTLERADVDARSVRFRWDGP